MDTHSGKILFQSEKIRRDWDAEFSARGLEPEGELAATMDELLLLCNEYLRDPTEELAENAFRTAYNAARAALEKNGHAQALALLRDGLAHSVLRSATLDATTVARLMDFVNRVGDGCWQALTDDTKRTFRLRAETHLKGDLRLAKHIQEHLLPKSIPRLPGYDFAGKLVPAAEVGGDYWSIKHYPKDDIVTLKLADISGHGIAAATLVSAVKFISGVFYPMAPSAAWVMERTNHVLVKETPSDVLVTMVYAWLQPAERRIAFVNAGHFPVLLLRRGQFHDIAPTGPVLGLMETSYGETRMTLERRDLIFFCSDGIVEARRGEPFGIERLKEILLANARNSAAEIVDAAIQAAIDYAGQPADDISAVAIRVL